MSIKYTYDKESNCLKAIPQMEIPEAESYVYQGFNEDGPVRRLDHEEYYKDIMAYNAHIESLPPPIPCTPEFKQWVIDNPKDEYEEGIDFFKRKEYKSRLVNAAWIPEEHFVHLAGEEAEFREIAYPISQTQPEYLDRESQQVVNETFEKSLKRTSSREPEIRESQEDLWKEAAEILHYALMGMKPEQMPDNALIEVFEKEMVELSKHFTLTRKQQ